jgi:ElaB/YqjD/DUF883 family membrane-anchored ribosome-binding protein
MRKNGSTTFEHRLDALKESVRNLVDIGGERAGELRHKMGDVRHQVMEGGSNAAHRVGSMVKDHPFVAIGVAFGIGYLAVRLLRTRY